MEPSEVEFNTIDPSRLALRLQAGDDWILIVSDNVLGTTQEVAEVLEGLDCGYCIYDTTGVQAWAGTPQAPVGTRACIVQDDGRWDDGYAGLETARTALRDRWSIFIWVANPQAVSRLVIEAPNIVSFFGAATAQWRESTMSDDDVEAQLQSLRAHHGMSDDTMLQLAASGDLSQDADYHLWLVLLGRGDLVKPHLVRLEDHE